MNSHVFPNVAISIVINVITRQETNEVKLLI